jgi:hypothetical protein
MRRLICVGEWIGRQQLSRCGVGGKREDPRRRALLIPPGAVQCALTYKLETNVVTAGHSFLLRAATNKRVPARLLTATRLNEWVVTPQHMHLESLAKPDEVIACASSRSCSVWSLHSKTFHSHRQPQPRRMATLPPLVVVWPISARIQQTYVAGVPPANHRQRARCPQRFTLSVVEPQLTKQPRASNCSATLSPWWSWHVSHARPKALIAISHC